MVLRSSLTLGFTVCTLAAISLTPASAQVPTTFAQISYGQIFSYSGGNSGVLSATGPLVGFNFRVLPPSSSGGFVPYVNGGSGLIDQSINAKINFSATANGTPVMTAGSLASQDFQAFTASITANGAQTVNGVSIADGANLLTLTVTTPTNTVFPTLSGNTSSNSATFSFSDSPATTAASERVTFSSHYIDFANFSVKSKGGSLSFSSATPPFTVSGGAINPFTASGAGTFSAQFDAVPEPGVTALLSSLGVCGTLFGVNRLRRRK